MPIYEYQCGQCGHTLESFEKMTDAPLTDCPVCGKPALQKLISAAGFQLKGTGWYATDFRNKGKAPESSTTKKTTTTDNSASTAETKTADSKPSTDTSTKDSAGS